MEREQIHDLAAAYALDALSPEERSAFAEHLRECGRCREEVATLSDAAAALAYAAEGPAPPEELRGRILETARADRRKVVPLRRRLDTRWLAAAAAVAALAIGLGTWAAVDLDGKSGGQVRVALTGADGSLTVGDSGNAKLVVRDMQAAPKGKTWEIWVIEDGKPRRAGLFPGGGDVEVDVAGEVPRGSTVAVTLERAGGVDAPSGQPRFSASVPA
jgi:anti-sigma-K factor RskA